jgi:uncharacterized protein
MIPSTPDAARLAVGVISDTHFDEPGDADFFRRLLSGPWAGVNLILCAGDVGDPDWFFSLAPPTVTLLAVAGNCDPSGDVRLPAKRVVPLGSKRVGIVHGWGAPESTLRHAAEAFAGERVDAVIFGHTHQPYLASRRQVTYFNPGSPTRPRGPDATVGLLTVVDDHLLWRHLKLEPRR